MVNTPHSTDSEAETHVKKFTRFLSQSSQRFFSSFIDSDNEKEKKANELFKQINQAIAQKSLVVIHYKDDSQINTAKGFETLVGRIYQHATNKEALVIKLQKNNQVRMISAKNIKKLSIIKHKISQVN